MKMTLKDHDIHLNWHAKFRRYFALRSAKYPLIKDRNAPPWSTESQNKVLHELVGLWKSVDLDCRPYATPVDDLACSLVPEKEAAAETARVVREAKRVASQKKAEAATKKAEVAAEAAVREVSLGQSTSSNAALLTALLSRLVPILQATSPKS